MKKKLFPVGKLPASSLKKQLARIGPGGSRMLIGPRYGEDATVIDMGDRLLVCSCDPITLATRRIGRYAVQVNANDIAVMGARPRWFWATLLLPEGESDEALVNSLFSDLRAECAELGIDMCGGHTEITAGLTRPIIAGFMAGETTREKLIDKRGIQPGDEIILTRGIAIEGTATIAAEHAGKLRGLDPKIIRRGENLIRTPGISVVREAMLAVESGEVHGMHDPTEGGLATGLKELAETAGLGMEIEADQIAIVPETKAICAHLKLDPMGLLASGSLIIVAGRESAERILAAYRKSAVAASLIGRMRERGTGLFLKRGKSRIHLPEFARDEITRVV
ncbi:MAG: AIR synthase family protein [Candidatus Aureabacteria bacterium]|nr:AIR synthase family protein [Candidatus Auribacterota bacterium]